MSDLDDDADDRVREALEARLIQEEIEAAAEQLHRNTRTLGELLLDWSDAGNHVRIEVGRYAWSGPVLGAVEHDGAGVVALAAAEGRVEIELSGISAVTQLVETSPRPAQPVGWCPPSLFARLRWCVSHDPPLTVRVGDTDAHVDGAVVAVSATHVEVQASSSSAVALRRPTFIVLPMLDPEEP